MKNKLTVKQYAAVEGISTAGVYQRISRGTLIKVMVDGLTYVYVNRDKTIKKPRTKKDEIL